MAYETVTADPGTGGETFAIDTVAGSAFPRTKIAIGGEGVAADVSISNPMPAVLTASSVNIGDVDVLSIAAGDNNIGNVDIVTMPTVTVNAHAVTNAGTFAVQEDGAALTALQLIDDPVATLGTTTYTEASTKGVIFGAVRRDADTSLVDTTNEIAPLQVNATGSLKVAITAGAAGGTALADEAAFTLASTSVTPIAGVYNASPDTLTTGKAGALQMTAARGLHSHLVDASGATIATLPVSLATAPALVAGSAVIGKVGFEAAGTGTQSTVSASASSVTLQASNANRKGLVVRNISSAILYVSYQATATAANATYELPGNAAGVSILELPVPIYSGLVTGIWASATGTASVTELA